MEHKQFTSDDSSHSPYSHQGFQADRFTKTTNNVNIPDTILENCSAESIGELPKMEAPKITIETYDSGEDKENVSYNQQVINNKPLNSSECLAIDSLYIKQCEEKLLESSFSDEEKNSEADKGLVNRQLLEIQSYAVHHNDTISTPPSLLRKEISMLRNEMAEAHEFHDLEIKVLREERSLDGVDSEKYIQLFERYSALMELYSNLKTELDEYRKYQESVRNELQSKTADYLESLCSQIETSDNSLNFSSSFISFSGAVKNSTMMGEASEVEATVVHDGTVLANDPLSITVDNDNGTFKTPLQTPLRSAKKLFPQESKSSVGKTAVETKDFATKRDLTLESEYNIQLLNLETAFYDKVKEVEDLEQRLFKVEDMSVVLHSEFERITSVYEKDNAALKEELSVKTEQLNDLMQKLFTETISLNPSLKDSLIDIPGTKLLAVFLETIMENCKKIKNDDLLTTIENLRNQISSQESKLTEIEVLKTTCEDLKAKLADASNTISIREEEIKMLQSHVTNVRQTREDLAFANERILELDCKIKTIEAEKKAAEERYRDLEIIWDALSFKFEGSQSQLTSTQEEKSQIENENILLKELHDSLRVQIMETENILKSQESEIITLKENLLIAESSQEQLQSQLKCIEDEKTELQKENESLRDEITAVKNTQIVETEALLKLRESEIIAVKENLMTAESSLIQLQAQLKSIEDEKIDLHKVCQELEEKNESLQDEITAAKNAQILETEAALKSREAEIIAVQEKLMTAESSLQELQAQLKSIEDEKAQLQKVCQELQQKNESLQDEIAAAKKIQIMETEAVLKSRESEIITVQEKLMTAQSTLQELQAQLKSIEDEKAQLQKVCQELQQKNESLQDEIMAAKNAQILETEALLKLRESEIIAVQEKLMTAESSLQELQAQLKSIEDEKSQLQRVCKELQEKNESLQDEITVAKNAQILETEAALKSREAEIIAVQEKLMTAKLTLQELQAQLKSIEDEKAELQKVCQELQQKNESLQDEIMAAKNAQILETETALKSREAEIIAVQEKLMTAESSLQELQAQLKSIEDEKSQLQRVCKELQEKNESLQDEITAVKNAQILETEAVLKSREAEIIAVQEKLVTAKLTLQELQAQLKSIEDEKAELQKVCQELQQKNESLQDEIIAAKKLENNPAFEKIQTENDNLKQKILELEQRLAEVRIELENASRCEIEELMRELEEVKKENSGFSKSLENLERGQKLLAELLTDLGSDNDLPCDRITNLLQKVPLQDSLDARETIIMSGIIETITKTCKNVQNELIKNFEGKTSEWEERRNLDLRLIKSLEDDLKLLGEKTEEEEARLKEIIMEKEDLTKVHEDLKNQLMEAERMISCCNEEIKSLKSQEDVLKKAKDDLSEAEELVERLNDQLLGVKAEKTAAEDKCRDLETIWETLSLKYEESQTQLASVQEEKSQVENENIVLKESHDSLKVQIMETEAALKSRESEIIAVKENLMTTESSLHQLQSQLQFVEDEKAELHKICQQLQQKNESLQDEITTAKKLEDNPAFEKVQTENDYLKQVILESEKRLDELKIELENVRVLEVEELKRKVEEVKKEKLGFSKSLENVERSQEYLAELLSEPGSNSDLPCERISMLIENASALKESLDPRETKIMSGFVETITKTCKNVQNELVRKFEGKKSEWEDQRNLDLKLIKSLEEDLKLLGEKRDKEEARLNELILEKEDLTKVHEDLKNQMMEAERLLSSYKEEINSLKTQEEVFKKARVDLSEAEEVIDRLNEELLGVKAEKTAAEEKYRDLETIWETLSLKYEESQTQLASAQEEKSQIENENILLKELHDSLKVQIMETEAALKSRESEIIAVKENLMTTEFSLQELQAQLKSIEDEKAQLQTVCEELQQKNESLQNEVTAAQKLENNPAFEKVQNENDYLKKEILESEKRMVELKIELENARRCEIEELMREVEEVKKEKLGFSKSLENLERGQKLLAELLTELGSDSDLPCVRITNLIQKVSLEYSLDARETKIMSGFLETVTKICKDVQNELIKNFEDKRSEWEYQRNIDLKLIKSLEDDIVLLREKRDEREVKMKEIILEKEDLLKAHEDLRNQMMEAERMLSCCNQEISSLKSQEAIFRKAKDDLSEAEEVIARMSEELLVVKGQKSETEQRYREMQEGVIKREMDGLKAENKNLKLGNDSLRDRVKELTKIIEETAGNDLKEDLSNTSTSLLNGMNLRSRSVKRAERYARRLDKLEEINHNLTELVIRILTTTEYPDVEKLNLSSAREFPKTMKKVLDHLNGFLSKMKDLKEENSQLDEECETYSNIIKDLKKEAVTVWKTNTEKTEALEKEIARLNAENNALDSEKQDLLAKLSRLNEECQKLQSAPKTEDQHTCICGNDSKKVSELKRTILMKEQKLLELQDVEAQTSTLKSQLEYLKTAFEREKKKATEEKEKNKKLQNQLKEATKSEKKSEDAQVLEELRMRGSISGGIVQEFGDKEKMRKLSKDIGILKELCRARYAEIKRLEAVNAALRSAAPKHPATPKNSNQMDSPIRSRGYNTRSKYQVRDVWKAEIMGKENSRV